MAVKAKQSKAIASAQFLMSLHRTFCSDEYLIHMTEKIERGMLDVDGQNTVELDHYLGFFEVIEHCIDQKALDNERVHRLFAYHLLKVFYYEPVNHYILQTKDYWTDLRKFANSMAMLERTRLQLSEAEVIKYYTTTRTGS